MKYKKTERYRYKLAEDEVVTLPVDLNCQFKHEYFEYDGIKLVIKKGYAWDGVTGPVFQSKSTKIPSLVHDVLKQAESLYLIPETRRKDIDECYRYFGKKSGMNIFRRNLHYRVIRVLYGLYVKYLKKDYDKVYEV